MRPRATRAARARGRQRAIALHRGLGIVAGSLVVVLAVTGVLLNHPDELDLYQHRVESEWLLDWYGMTPDEEPVAFALDGAWIASLEHQLYYDGHPLTVTDGPIVGALAFERFHVAASRDAIWLVSKEPPPTIVDRLDSSSLPGPVAQIGRDAEGSLVVRVDDDSLHRVDADFLRWSRLSGADAITWSEPRPLPEEQRARLLASHRGEGLTRFRLIADIHSGRVLGGFGVLLVDGAAVAMLLLTGSGFYGWATTRRPGAATTARDAPNVRGAPTAHEKPVTASDPFGE